jgi:hypothetical protein
VSKELIIEHDDRDNPQNYTAKVERAFAAHDLNLHMHEVEKLEDDFRKGKRVLKVKNTRYFVM